LTTPATAARVRVRVRRPDEAPPAPPTSVVTRPAVPWRVAGCAAAAVLYATSTGDAFVAAALLGLAIGPWAGAAAVAAAAATVARWGTADLGVVAGDQDVLGPAVATGPVAAAVGSGLVAVGVLLGVTAGSREDRALVAVLAGGLGAGVLASGPAPTSASAAGLRAAGAVGGVALAWLLTRPALRRRVPAWFGAVVGVAGLVAVVVAP
jgi:hypothetical protein